MERVVYKLAAFVVALSVSPGWAQEAQPTDSGGTVLQEQLSITDGQAELEGTREYVAPESSPFADARFESLELRVQRLEEALGIAVERLQTEKERRQRLEDLLKDAGVIR
ncbi:hypothetical protein SAMN04488527_16411 [Aliiroseovarius crassostreae]|uniref:YbgF trimerisation domain-containing protein n=1 Tax=Aliiroseovarius crassostreae TaxID=154981 RepID=A0A0P7JNX2_9RHOB|nr:hypothetical protein [Aliiroseovarius crassostreae]KPN62908.1 hypothetical protein AKJ29_01825 [Aliiroseovarius crassostreae]SFU98016.1 hypothetical protein SAMN04488527_16411 [Aliiroseovarius crassostreae]